VATSNPPVPAPIYVIKKKKGGHGGHHGGAWKVAYADFVTAMMSLFIVLWLLNSSQDVRKAIGGYFQDPAGKGRQIGSGMAGTGDALIVKKDDMNQIQAKLQSAIKQMPHFQKTKDNIEMSVTGEGLRIELLETKNGMFFESGSAAPSEEGRELLTKLAEELGKLPNRVLIEGHTDAKPFNGSPGYSNWELSADRANAARRLMEPLGLKPGQVLQVRGFADQDLRNPKDPNDAANRRISVIVKYDEQPDAPDDPPAKDGKGKGKPDESAKPKEAPKPKK
jgi:chemotaxis protein MotB